jgi:Flp pilus assembly protein TadB
MTESASLNRIGSASGLLGLILLASCRPVMTVGWVEILILIALVAFLFGPLLFRLFTWFQKYRSEERDKERRKK